MNNTYKEITKTVTQTKYEITCGKCGNVWVSNNLIAVCEKCHSAEAEKRFQEKYHHLIGGRVAAIISNGDDYRRELKAFVICDEDGDYWKIAGDGQDLEYGYKLSVEEMGKEE